MMKLLDTDGAWLAIGISVFFILVGVVMKRVFVKVLKHSEAAAATPPSTANASNPVSESPQHD